MIGPCGEHVLDWFRITMRVTVLVWLAKGVPHHDKDAGARLTKLLERIRWKLWHGDTIDAREAIAEFEEGLFGLESDYLDLRKFVVAARQFGACIASNAATLSIMESAIAPASTFPRRSLRPR